MKLSQLFNTRNNDAIHSHLKQILLFLLLAFSLPLLCSILMINTTLFRSGPFQFIAYGVEAMTPSLAAILTVLYFENGRGLKQFLKKCYIANIHLKWILIALLLPVAVVGVSKLLSWQIYGCAPVIGTLSSKKIIVVCWALIAEELGWRGFMQEKLQVYFNDLTLPLITGIIWAVWHYHYFISGTMTVPVILFALGCVTDSYVYYALTKSVKGNIIPASAFHFSGNLCFNLFLINPEYNNGSNLPYFLFVMFSFITAVIAAAVTHKHRLKA